MYGSFGELCSAIITIEQGMTIATFKTLFGEFGEHHWELWIGDRINKSLLTFLPLICAADRKKIYDHFDQAELFEREPSLTF